MKRILPTALAVACLGLVIALVVTKRGDNAQIETDAGAITDFSNRLDLVQTKLAICNGTALTFSNNLNESRSESLTFSNQLTAAQSAIALDAEQITNLTRQVTDMKLENQTLSQRVADLNGQMTNQVAGLTRQLTATQTSLAQTNQDLVQAYKDFALLENRLRVNVAERVVVERQFNNPLELQAQLQKLKKHPPGVITPESIYAGLDVEVNSKGKFHVISPE